eukprot:TRINITY_DN14417_c0_g1_i1.p1 TRINITY_DN14417_c0_g1~~TRINITY_DN14417_c0_g1_i1.p1  ORF type:complete len:216 (+),score=22.18 TRINITY_DN14417_c0_g1_i1:64-711(+)
MCIRDRYMGKKDVDLPLVLCVNNSSSGTYLIVGCVGASNVPGRKKNEFGRKFMNAAEKAHVRLKYENFESSVVEIQREDLLPFLEELTELSQDNDAANQFIFPCSLFFPVYNIQQFQHCSFFVQYITMSVFFYAVKAKRNGFFCAQEKKEKQNECQTRMSGCSQKNLIEVQEVQISFHVPLMVTLSYQAALCRPCLLYTSPSPRDGLLSRMPSSA